jgi:hypothetical protein
MYLLGDFITIASPLRVLVFKTLPLLSFYRVLAKTTEETLSGKVLYNATYRQLFISIKLHFIFYFFVFIPP